MRLYADAMPSYLSVLSTADLERLQVLEPFPMYTEMVTVLNRHAVSTARGTVNTNARSRSTSDRPFLSPLWALLVLVQLKCNQDSKFQVHS